MRTPAGAHRCYDIAASSQTAGAADAFHRSLVNNPERCVRLHPFPRTSAERLNDALPRSHHGWPRLQDRAHRGECDDRYVWPRPACRYAIARPTCLIAVVLPFARLTCGIWFVIIVTNRSGIWLYLRVRRLDVRNRFPRREIGNPRRCSSRHFSGDETPER
jgi:hypothetical protein